MGHSTKTSRLINAAPERIYYALTDPRALETWQAPGDMTGKVHDHDLREGGGYTMSLYYPETETGGQGKTNDREDRFSVVYTRLEPGRHISETVRFDSPDPVFAGEMTIDIFLQPEEEGTHVTFLFTDIPDGIKPEDNEAGTASSLEKLARYVE